MGEVYVVELEPGSALELELCVTNTVLLDPNWDRHDPRVPPKEYRTALHSVCAFGNIELARWLVDIGASIDCEIYPGLGFTPLFCAVNYGHHNVMRWLLESGANPNAKVVEPDYQQMYSDFDPHVNSLFDDYCTAVHGSTPIFVACEVGDAEAVCMLLEFGANPSLGRRHEDCYNLVEGHEGPLAVAIRERRIDIAEFLVRAGADIHAECVLANSLVAGIDYIKLIATNGFRIDLANVSCCVYIGSAETAMYLVENVENFCTSEIGHSLLVQGAPLIFTGDRFSKFCSQFVARGGDVNRVARWEVMTDVYMWATLLSIAVRRSDSDVVRYLLTLGASPNICVENVNLCLDAIVRCPSIDNERLRAIYYLAQHGHRFTRPFLFFNLENRRGPRTVSLELSPDSPVPVELTELKKKRSLIEVMCTSEGPGYVATLAHLSRRIVVAHCVLSPKDWESSPQWLRAYIAVELLLS